MKIHTEWQITVIYFWQKIDNIEEKSNEDMIEDFPKKTEEGDQDESPSKIQVKKPIKKGYCPLCNSKISTASFVITSQKSYCYKCLHEHITEKGSCPESN